MDIHLWLKFCYIGLHLYVRNKIVVLHKRNKCVCTTTCIEVTTYCIAIVVLVAKLVEDG